MRVEVLTATCSPRACLPGEPRSTIILYQKSPIFASGYKKTVKEKALVGLFLIFRRPSLFPGGSAGEWRRSSAAGKGTSRSEDPAKGRTKEKILFFSEKRLTPAPQGANLLWILSGEQFSLYEKGKKDKKPPLQRFANFSETLAPAYLRDMRSAGGKVSFAFCFVFLRSFARSRAFLSVSGRVHSTA